jgi:hypothetical protein
VLSSLVSLCRDPEPDLTIHRETVRRFLESAYLTFRHTQAYIRQHRPDRIYLFNGRFAAMRAVFRAAQTLGVECLIHERGCDQDHYALTHNHLPHDLTAVEKLIRDHWSITSSEIDKSRAAECWYQERRAGIERVWHSFTKDQQPERLPSNWNPAKRNISLFSSSDDEFAAIGDYWNPTLYTTQTAAVARIARELSEQTEIHLYLRMHPNLRMANHRQKQEMLTLNFPNLSVIPPESMIDSYALMSASSTIATFGSTIGIEGVFWGKPSVLLGPSFYQGLGGTYQPESHHECVELLKQSLKPQSKLGAVMYGYWQQTHGVRFRYAQMRDLFEGQFKSHTLYARPPKKTIGDRIKNELGRVAHRFKWVAKAGRQGKSV